MSVVGLRKYIYSHIYMLYGEFSMPAILGGILHLASQTMYFGVSYSIWKDLQNNNSDTYFLPRFFAYKIKSNYLMTKQAVWTFRKFFFLQFDSKFASKQQRLAKIGTILWLLLSTQISQVWHTTRRDENAECDMHGLERPLRVSATQWLSSDLL